MKIKLFRKFDKKLAAELRSQRRPITIGIVCTTLASLLYTSVIALTKLATKQVEIITSAHGAQVQQALQLLGIACLVVVGVFGIRYWFVRGQTYFLSLASNRLAADLRIRLFSKLMRMPVSYFNDRRAGAIQSILTNDVNVYQNAVGIIRDSIEGPIKAVGALIWILIIQPYLAIIAFLLIPVMVVIIQRNSRKMKMAQGQVQEDLAHLSATGQEVLQGARVVKAFNAESRMDEQYHGLVEKSFGSQMRAVATLAALRPLVDFIGAIALALVLYIGGYLASLGKLSVADITAMALAMDMINQGFRSLAGVSNTYATVQAASRRIHSEVFDFVETMPDAPDAKTLGSIRGKIEFRDVSFQYPDGTEALKGISFLIEPGTSLALVGRSGAGKSTVADLLLRFYNPTSGTILIDDVDVRSLKADWIRSEIGVVPQQTFLFAGSIDENVRLGNPQATQEDVEEALRLAHATEFTRELAQRESSELGERGVKLSGGQMQRVAIARALIRRPAILLLDEATSALDADSEKAVTEALEEVMQARTTLFIAHRLTTAARADKILYMREGETIEYGSHRELMEKDGEYAALFRVFSSGLLEEGP